MAKKADTNQQEIASSLRALGASVASLHEVGRGCPDLLVGWRGANYLLEVKNADGRDRLTDQQRAWHAAWRGQVAVVHTLDDALAAIGAMSP